jgi:hypothetical protein
MKKNEIEFMRALREAGFSSSLCESINEIRSVIFESEETAGIKMANGTVIDGEELHYPENAEVIELMRTTEGKPCIKLGKLQKGRIAEEDEEVMSREGKAYAKKGDLIIDDGVDDSGNKMEYVPARDMWEDKPANPEGTMWRKKGGQECTYWTTEKPLTIKLSWQPDAPLSVAPGYKIVLLPNGSIAPNAPEVFDKNYEC